MEPLANGVHAVRLAPPGAERVVVIGAGTDRARHAAGGAARGPPCTSRWSSANDDRRDGAPALGAHAAYASPQEARSRASPTSSSTRSAQRRPAGSAWSCCAGRDAGLHRAGGRRHDARLPRGGAASTASRAPTRTRCRTSSRPTRGSSAARRPRRRPAGGAPARRRPEQFARLAEGPPPPEFKVFLAVKGAKREPDDRGRRRLERHRPGDRARVRRAGRHGPRRRAAGDRRAGRHRAPPRLHRPRGRRRVRRAGSSASTR